MSKKFVSLSRFKIALIASSIPFLSILIALFSHFTSYEEKGLLSYINGFTFDQYFDSLFYSLSFCGLVFVFVYYFCQPINKAIFSSFVKKQSPISILFKNILLILICVQLTLLFNAFSQGVFVYMYLARAGVISLGFVYYLVVLLSPLLLAVSFRFPKSRSISIISLVLLAILNLVSGFRITLIWSIMIISIFNYRALYRMNWAKLIPIASIVVYLLYLYQSVRETANLVTQSSTSISKSFVESLNRSYPFVNIALINTYDLNLPIESILGLLIQPYNLMLNVFIDGKLPLIFDQLYVNEVLFRSFLIWRGTPLMDATGISISIIPYSLLYKYYGLFLFAFLISFIFSKGLSLLLSNSLFKTLTGAVLISFYLAVSFDSFIEGVKLLSYSLFFVFLLFIGVSLFRTLFSVNQSTL